MPRDVGNKEVGMTPGFPEEERTKGTRRFSPETGIGAPEKRIELRTTVGPGFETGTSLDYSGGCC